jgi:hypothetical protein
MRSQCNAKKIAINTPADAANETSGPVEKSRIAYDAATAAAKARIEDSRSDNSFRPEKMMSRSNKPTRDACTCPRDTPVMPIAESHIARQSGHFGSRIKPIIELLEVKPARSGFRCFAQLISATPLLLCGFATRTFSTHRCFAVFNEGGRGDTWPSDSDKIENQCLGVLGAA